MSIIGKLDIRWMIRRDMDYVAKIEQECFKKNAWHRDDFVNYLSQVGTAGFVAVWEETLIVGYMVTWRHSDRITIDNIAVMEEARRCGIGRALLKRATQRMRHSRKFVEMKVAETNLDGQLFARQCGMICDRIEDHSWEDCKQMAYRFVYREDWSEENKKCKNASRLH